MSTANLPAKRTPPQGGNLATIVEGARDRLMAVLPSHLTPERITQLLYVLAPKTKHLADCVPETIVTSLVQVGTLDLDLSPGRNEAFLIPRWNKDAKVYECTFMPGYKGLEKLAVRTGVVAYIEPCEVCEGDTFDVCRTNEGTVVSHRPAYQTGRGNITHLYTMAHMFDGKVTVEVMTAEACEEIHQRSEGAQKARREGGSEFGPWVTDWKEMALKTVLKRHCKRFPRRSDPVAEKAYQQLQTAIDADNREYQVALESPVPEHHAINHDNATGHGSGAYADPETVRDYQEWLRGFVLDVNTKWADHLTLRMPDAEAKELLSTWQVSGHLCKWAGTVGLINAPEKPANRQYDQFAAVAWQRHRPGLIEEAEDYGRRKWREAWQELKAKRRTATVPATEQRRGDVPVVADDADPEHDFDATPTDEDKWAK